MCVLVALHRGDPPRLVIAANRDERTDRPWLPPALLLDQPPVFGGKDLAAGGTWLAVNLESGVVVGVANARLGAPRGERSRGDLVLEVARQADLAEGIAVLGELDLARYGPFNLLVADAERIWTATNEPRPLLRREKGPAVAIANDPLAAPGERVRKAADAAATLAAAAVVTDAAIVAVLADHDGPDPLCRHGRGYGTVCAAGIDIGPRRVLRYRFAAGPPCRTPFVEVPLPSPSYS